MCNGVPLIGVLIADKPLNRGAVRTKISIVKDNLLAITVTQGLAIEDVNPYVVTFWVQVSQRHMFYMGVTLDLTIALSGKEILIKALAIPAYPMTCFKLPSTLCYEIAMIMANFW
ncbi:hypothetical protein GBA52_004966 [Prunus armeniaca]|nr:hypothetical protein GBA52_004966 [Prunus armeniaca]